MFSDNWRAVKCNNSILKVPKPKATPKFIGPEEVGHFSVDSRRNIHYDRSQMKYYVPQSNVGLALDLDKNYWNTVQKEDEFDVSEKMEEVLRWIMHQNFSEVDSGVTDFVTTRGSLHKLLCSPYHYCLSSDLWSICASKLNNTIYFSIVESDWRIHQKSMKILPEKAKRMMSWGLKFEQYMTSNSPYGAPNMTSVTYQLEDFSIVLRSKLDKYSLLYKAQIDGLKSSASAGVPSNYIEFKTSRNSPPHYADQAFLKSKSVKWWSQLFLSGVQEIVCGFRDYDGIVTSIESFSQASLTGIGKGHWKPDKCLKFCHSFLNILKKNVVETDHRVVHKFDFRKDFSVEHQRLINPEKRLQVIPDWYASALNQRL